MRLSIDNPDATQLLLDYLSSWSDVVAEQVGENEVEVTLLGSYRHDAMEMEIMLRVRAWAEAQRARGLVIAVC